LKKCNFLLLGGLVNSYENTMKKRTDETRFDDILWKGILSDLFFEFLELCHPELYEKVDTARPVVFFDKEFPRLYPASKGKKRHADIIAKVYLKTGDQLAIIVHVEAQGYPDETFAYRMDVYNYRAHDRHQLDVESIALLTDNDPDFRPSEYRRKVVATERVLKFLTIKLMDFSPEMLRESWKLFACALEAAWYGLKKHKPDDEGLLKIKLDLMRRLIKQKAPREKIIALLSFIKEVVRFDDKSKQAIFETKLYNYDNHFDMESTTSTQEMPRTFRALFEIQRREQEESEKKQQKLQKLLDAERKKLKAERQKAEADKMKMEAEKQKVEAEKLKAEVQRQLAEAEKQKAEADKIQAIKILLQKNISISDICEAMGVSTEFVKTLASN